MSIIKCPECGKEISNKAKMCINCGYPLAEIAMQKKAECPFLFLSRVDRRLYQRYITAEINMSSRSNSFYDSAMDLAECLLNYSLSVVSIVPNGNERTIVAMLKSENVREYFLSTLNYSNDAYDALTSLCISINTHKHSEEKLYSSTEAVQTLKVIHDFYVPFFSTVLKEKIEGFDASFYEEVVLPQTNNSFIATVQASPSYPIKGFEGDMITLQYQDYKLYYKNRVLYKFVGDTTTLDLEYEDLDTIEKDVFKNNLLLQKIILPKKLRHIKSNAFRCCTNLVTVQLADSVEIIGDGAFYNCENLVTVPISENTVSIGKEAFFNCKKIESICFGKAITEIRESAFENCIGLKQLSFNVATVRIHERCFANCTNLHSIHFSGEKIQLDKYAFSNNSIKGVFIPKCVYGWSPSFGEETRLYFEGTEEESADQAYAISLGYPRTHDWSGMQVQFNCVDAPHRNEAFLYLIKKTSDNRKYVEIVRYLSKKSTSVIPDIIDGLKVESIGERAFSNCKTLVAVTIPNTVTSIGNQAFSNCVKLMDCFYTGDVSSWCNIKGLDQLKFVNKHINGALIAGELDILTMLHYRRR